jgi:hypothetical protein
VALLARVFSLDDRSSVGWRGTTEYSSGIIRRRANKAKSPWDSRTVCIAVFDSASAMGTQSGIVRCVGSRKQIRFKNDRQMQRARTMNAIPTHPKSAKPAAKTLAFIDASGVPIISIEIVRAGVYGCSTPTADLRKLNIQLS